MNRADIGKFRIFKKIDLPGEMIGLCGFYEVIKYIHQMIVTLIFSVQIMVAA